MGGALRTLVVFFSRPTTGTVRHKERGRGKKRAQSSMQRNLVPHFHFLIPQPHFCAFPTRNKGEVHTAQHFPQSLSSSLSFLRLSTQICYTQIYTRIKFQRQCPAYTSCHRQRPARPNRTIHSAWQPVVHSWLPLLVVASRQLMHAHSSLWY